MEQSGSTRNLESRVEILGKLRDAAYSSSLRNGVVAGAMIGAGVFAYGMGAFYFSEIKAGSSGLMGPIVMTLGGLSTAIGLIFGGMAVSDYHRGGSLSDRIAEIKQLPGYKAAEGPSQKSQ